MAGSWLRAMQQFAWAVLLGADGCTQQLCAVLLVCGRQVPAGASNVLMSTKDTAARWKTPLNMDSGYHDTGFPR